MPVLWTRVAIWVGPRSAVRASEFERPNAQDGKLSTGRRMGAGFMAGITEALVIVTPFEVVKIRLQQQKGVDKALLKYKASSADLVALCVEQRCWGT